MADSYKDITITDGSIVNSLTDVPDFIEPEHISLHNQTTDTAISSSNYTITNNSRNGYGAYDAATISLNAGTVSNSDVVRITRNSSHVVNSVNYPLTDFTNGSNLTAEALDKNSVQCIFRAKELEEQGVTVADEYLTQTEGDARYLQSFTETNDLSSAVTWANIPDANVPESAVTQHEAALTVTESQISDLGTYLTGNQTITLTGDATGSGTTSITVTVLDDSHNHVIANVDGLQAELDSKLESVAINDVSDVVITTPADNEVLAYDNTSGNWINQTASEAGLLTTETNDLTAAVTWANVPDANITESSVTQHQAALSITESQISDLDHYADADVDTHLNTSTATADEVLSWNGTDYAWVSNAGGGGGGLSNVVEDTTPQLGGDLDLNSNDITGTGNVDISGTVTATTVVSDLDGSVIFQAKNVNAGTISKGQVVYISGLSGNNPEVDLARANSSSTMPAFGIAAEDIATTVVGDIVTFGSLQGLDVADFGETGITFSLGDTVYVSSSEAGKLTNVAPSGESNQIQNIGRIQRIDPTTNATIKVGGAGRSAATPALNDGNIFIGDASNNSSTANLQTLVESYSINSEVNDLTAAVTWANVPDANITESSVTQHQAALSITESQISDLQSYLTTVALNDVSDVTITTPSTGQVLKYNGTIWVNDADTGGIDNVVEDTTPQLGGDLDLNSSDITGTGNITLDEGTLSITNSAAGDADAIELTNTTGAASVIKSKRGLVLSADYDNNSGGSQSDISFETDGTQRANITNNGLLVGTTNLSPAPNNVVGSVVRSDGFVSSNRSGGVAFSIGRAQDGALVQFYSAGTLEGNISVSGTTVSYNGGHLARWSQLADNTRDESIVKGTVMSNLDQMAEWTTDGVTEENEQLNCMKVSDVEGDANVAGVFVNWDNDDDIYTNDMNIAMTGDMVIRIAQGTTVQRGDLLMSAGDGTAKPQGDDIVRSKTIAKVTSTTVSSTYDDGSYLVPCVLMAC